MDTPSRRGLMEPLPIVPVPVLAEGKFQDKAVLLALLGQSNYITEEHVKHLQEDVRQLGLDEERHCRETDASNLRRGCISRRRRVAKW